MFTCIVFLISVAFAVGTDKAGQTWTCSKVPSACLPFASDSSGNDECYTDSDCPIGAQCCYKGCARKCVFPNPCEKVICKTGFLCQSRETPCEKKPCHPEATCLPEIQVRCAKLICDTEECKPGYSRATDTSGCPTCQCVRKPECEPACYIFCAYGYEERTGGCPSCFCKPEPRNPCSNMSCGQGEECRLVQAVCKKEPCEPAAACVAINLPLYENACSLTDPTTVGLPVLEHTATSDVDCYHQPCPEHTVCTIMGREINRCCWQASQERVLPPPKVGECPKEMVNWTGIPHSCQSDEECPGEQKCCHKNVSSDVESPRSLGYCADPFQNYKKVVSSDCHKSFLLRFTLRWFGFC